MINVIINYKCPPSLGLSKKKKPMKTSLNNLDVISEAVQKDSFDLWMS